MLSSINIKRNDLVANQELNTDNSQNSNIRSSINAQSLSTIVESKKIFDYEIATFLDKDISLVNTFIIEGDYQKLAKLFQQDKTIITKLLLLPKEQSPIITAVVKKQCRCVDVLCHAILQYARVKPIPEYLQQYLFIYACKNPDNDISDSILSLYSNTAITLKSRQIKSLLIEAMNHNNKQILKLLITKFITPHANKEKKYATLLQYAIKKNNQQMFTLLINQTAEHKIAIFKDNILIKITPYILGSNNNYFANFLIKKAMETNNINILFNVVYYFIAHEGMSHVVHILAKLPQLFLMKKSNHNYKTILHIVFFHTKPKYALKLLEFPFIKQHINNPFYYTCIKHKGKYDAKEIALTNCRKEQSKNIDLHNQTKIVCNKLSTAKIRKSILNDGIYHNKEFDYLDLATCMVEQKSKEILTEVLTNIANISSIGVYLYNILSDYKKTNNQTYTFGDENATINIINRLIFLGCKKINLYCVLSQNIDEHSKKIVVDKISYLLNVGSHNKNNFIKKGQCFITLFFSRQGKPSADTHDDLILTFDSLDLFNHTRNIKNVINLRPFLFGKHFEEMCIKQPVNTDIQNGNYKILTLNNPTYSILKEEENNLPISYDSIDGNKKWFYDLLEPSTNPSKASLLVECIATITKSIKKQQINHGVVYGLHHNAIVNKDDILNNWLNLLKKATKNENNKPIVLSIPANTLKVNIKRLAQADTFVFDLINKTYKIEAIQKAFKEKKNIIVLYPTLPKTIFYHLINQANVPILVEGANTTSYALQQAIPYLSVLPNGRTSIPTKMGDPLQALLMEAISYKITMNPIYLSITTKIFELVNEERYQDAINLIKKLNDKPNKNEVLLFFGRNDRGNFDDSYEDIDDTCEDVDDAGAKLPYKDKITVLSLLKKAQSSPASKEFLLHILNPDMHNVLDYIQQSQNPDSLISWHFKLMQYHVNLEINNTVDISLYKFFKQLETSNGI